MDDLCMRFTASTRFWQRRINKYELVCLLEMFENLVKYLKYWCQIAKQQNASEMSAKKCGVWVSGLDLYIEIRLD